MFDKKVLTAISLACLLTGLTYVGGTLGGLITPNSINWIEIAAVVTSYACVFLCVSQTRWNYPIGILGVLFYSIFFFQSQTYALALFNLYLVFSLAYGWFRWGSDDRTIPVTFVQLPWWLGYVGLGTGIYGLLFAINSYFGIEMSQFDVWIAILSGVAQFLMDNKKLESWGVWILVNILSIWFFFNEGWYFAAIQYSLFLCNAFVGAYAWYSSYRSDKFVMNQRNTI